MVRQQTRFIPLQGGLDLVTPAIQTPEGHTIGALNYEPAERGYRRIDGFERIDGRTKPSEASYWVIDFDQGSAAIQEDDSVVGATSSATGKALIDAVVESGTYGGGDAAGYLVLTEVTGTFQDDENLQVSSVTHAVANGVATERGADNDTDADAWLQDAIETARAMIGEVPGGGSIRGVWVYKGVRYAFRDDAASGASECRMYKATAAGWTQVTFGRTLDFDAGTTEFVEGETLTGVTSGATATIERMTVQSGDWSSNDAAGYFVLSGVSGAFQNDENVTSSSGSADADGVDSAITLAPGGTYAFLNHNFYGASNLGRMYGCDGVNPGFEFDGSVFAPIRTGMAADTPTHVGEHRNHLFFAFPGGSLQHSSTGRPLEWSPLTGASEIGMGDDITGLLSNVASALVVFTQNQVAVLQGDDSANWALRKLSDDAGALPGTAQRMGEPVYMDDRGLRGLSATEAYGDFLLGTITRNVDPLLRGKRRDGVTPTASIRVRSKDQYRVFFSDETGLTVFMGSKRPQVMPFDFGMVVRCTCSAEDENGEEMLLFGSDDGYVYQMDSGTSFDGAKVPAYCRMPFNHVGSAAQDKRFHKVTMEVESSGLISLGLSAEVAYGKTGTPPVAEQSFSVSGGGSFWDAANWSEFLWDMPVEGRAEAHVNALGQNLSVLVISEATYEQPHTLHGMILNFSPRGLLR